MVKVNIQKPTGALEVLNILSAFKVENDIYVILDSEKMGSMGLPIIYVSKYIGKLEKINDANEWQSVKNYLKGIINGTNFQYVNLDELISADEVYYTPLTLPQSSFDLIKSRYVVQNVELNTGSNNVLTAEPDTVANLSDVAISSVEAIENVAPVNPIMPDNNVGSNIGINSVPITNEVELKTDSVKLGTITEVTHDIKEDDVLQNNQANTKIDSSFDTDKETFLRACENMFDALVSKYQKKLSDLERREHELLKKEQEVEMKLKNASEHLANAEAREHVANIAHDNAQRIMDLSSLMPNNPNDTQTGVI